MTVYAIAQIEIFNREAYNRYQAKFWDVFKQFDGSLLINNENPELLEGEWSKDKLVMMSFPSKGAFYAWASSPEYSEIVVDRRAGANLSILLSEEFSFDG